MKKPTIADIAEMAGVSKPTVSRFLKQENVKPEFAKRIQEAITTLGYVPKSYQKRLSSEETTAEVADNNNHDANSLKMIQTDAAANGKRYSKKSATYAKQTAKKCYHIAVLTRSLANARSQSFISAIQSVFHEKGCVVYVFAAQGDEALEKSYLKSLVMKNVDALIVEHCSSPEFIEKQVNQIPVLFIHQTFKQDAVLNEIEAGHILAKYLLDKKHLIIRYLGVDEHLAKQHLQGISDEYHAVKQPIDIIQVTSNGTFDHLFHKIKEMFVEKIDLLILQSDDMAVPLGKYLREYHIAVPQNVSVISFGGTPIANMMSPALTTLSYEYLACSEYMYHYIAAVKEHRELPQKKAFFHIVEKDSVR